MAKMIDEKPSFKGEGKVWNKLSEYLPSDMVVYNQREINGREYDFCVMAENLGIVVIEVKGCLIGQAWLDFEEVKKRMERLRILQLRFLLNLPLIHN